MLKLGFCGLNLAFFLFLWSANLCQSRILVKYVQKRKKRKKNLFFFLTDSGIETNNPCGRLGVTISTFGSLVEALLLVFFLLVVAYYIPI